MKNRHQAKQSSQQIREMPNIVVPMSPLNNQMPTNVKNVFTVIPLIKEFIKKMEQELQY